MRQNLNDVMRGLDSDPIWVLNKTKGNDRGPVLFTCPALNGSGSMDNIRVDDTFLPLDLTEQLPRNQILQSPDFRKAARAGMIIFIDEDEAKQILSKPGVAEEQARLRGLRNRLAGSASEIFGDNAGSAQVVPTGGPQQEREGPRINPRVEAALERFSEQGEVAVINTLRSIADDLNRDDRSAIRAFAEQRDLRKLLKFERNLDK